MSTHSSCSFFTRIARIGPLTTVFTPPPDCTGNPRFNIYAASSPTPPYQLLNQDTVGVMDVPESCEPSKVLSIRSGGLGRASFYSPGICPHGYFTANKPDFDCPAESETLQPSETLILCCRNGWWVDPTTVLGRWVCTTTFTTPSLVTIAWTVSGPRITGTVTPSPSLALWDDPIQIIVMGNGQSSPTGPGSAESGSSPPDSGLSKDAKIAIGVAVPMVVIAIATAIGLYVLFRRRLAKRLAAGGVAPVPEVLLAGKPELEDTAVGRRNVEEPEPRPGPPTGDKPELDSTTPAGPPVSELSNRPLEYELSATSGPLFELPPGIPSVPELEGDGRYRGKPA
ncbi:hypothetical protein B0T14DRAFT_513921 [Immersiella caudata]|uniref:Uncharacterized protein n=1 Tax=Immersiella caudata TaxID=314043 RepID=A0AA39WW43_9PEZI|nr:hypothetical protein B0T14DRAFT_513921 [Immersiella caudata]